MVPTSFVQLLQSFLISTNVVAEFHTASLTNLLHAVVGWCMAYNGFGYDGELSTWPVVRNLITCLGVWHLILVFWCFGVVPCERRRGFC